MRMRGNNTYAHRAPLDFIEATVTPEQSIFRGTCLNRRNPGTVPPGYSAMGRILMTRELCVNLPMMGLDPGNE